MGAVFKKQVTRPLPKAASIVTRGGKRIAKWKSRSGKPQDAEVVEGQDGSLRVRVDAGTYTAKYRDGEGIVREVATGCRDRQAAQSVLADLERRAERVRSRGP